MTARRQIPLLVLGLAACDPTPANPPPPPPLPVRAPNPSPTLRLAADLEWTALNPARGDASPRAATLWGDRTQEGASAFLVRFVDGFASPPHIHNVSYRAVVLEGEVHNADPAAAELWMTPGSFWTQPYAQEHITSSRGDSMAYVEIDSGPYLVRPAADAQETAEKALNVDASNVVWTPSELPGVEVAWLWGEPVTGRGGAFLRVDQGQHAIVETEGRLDLVVIAGQLTSGQATAAPGSLLSGAGAPIRCASASCVVYARVDGGVRLRPWTR